MIKKLLSVLTCFLVFAVFSVSVSAEDVFPAAASVSEIPAKSAVLMDASSGRVLFENNADEQMPPASITKIMTLLLTFEAMENGTNKVYLPVKLTKDGKFTGESLLSAEQLGLLSKHIDSVLVEIGKEIFGGNVSLYPVSVHSKEF